MQQAVDAALGQLEEGIGTMGYREQTIADALGKSEQIKRAMSSLAGQGMGRKQMTDAVFNALDRSGWWMKSRERWYRKKGQPVFTSYSPTYTKSIHGTFAKAKGALDAIAASLTPRP